MGIHNRDYYRDEPGPSSGGQFPVWGWLVVVNVVVFFVGLAAGDNGPERVKFTSLLDLRAAEVLAGEVWRPLTYGFLHNPVHLFQLVFNMLAVWWFGRDAEERSGPAEFLAFYLAATVLTGLGFLLGVAAGLVPAGVAVAGASGPVTALLVLSACRNPRQTVLLFGLVPVPVWALVALSVALDVTGRSGVPAGAALGVQAAALLWGLLYWRSGVRLTGLLSAAGRARRARGPSLRVYREGPADTPPRPAPPPREDAPVPAAPTVPDEELEARSDQILEKVARSGQGSLTEEERAVLFRASELYKKRRR